MRRGIAITASLNKMTVIAKFASDPFVETPTIIRFFLFALWATKIAVGILLIEIPISVCLELLYWVCHRQIPHLVICDSPTPCRVEFHQLPECDIVIVYVIPSKI